MYEDLVRSLRICAVDGSCRTCPRFLICSDEEGPVLAGLFNEAADAIEELSMKLHGDEAAIAGMKREIERMVVAGKARWIPVTEEPPLKVGDDGYNGYLVFANGYYEVADYTTDKFDNAPLFFVNGEYEPTVTHFMPLPEPPKEEGET